MDFWTIVMWMLGGWALLAVVCWLYLESLPPEQRQEAGMTPPTVR